MTGLQPAPELPFGFKGGMTRTGPVPLVMGILNVTPDSFSDGGVHFDLKKLVESARIMASEGAAFIDIGGESSRPGASPVSEKEELDRVIPAIQAVREISNIPISIDTIKPKVALEAVFAGANIINDIRGMVDPSMRSVAAETGAGVIIMHMRGDPQTMQAGPFYHDVSKEVCEFLTRQMAILIEDGVSLEKIMVDPGIGFGKTQEHNLKLVKELKILEPLKRPILLGVSRKSLVGFLTGRKVEERLAGTLALQAFTMGQMTNLVFRVHDVGPTADLCKVWTALIG